eukprot:TRINITY_DN43463_c0_g1_i1.p1 TRINITY_DN43463_c0_g1~~TRINITY_DN43463_c0_g1_i1.p1  ORF type:complete len:104 (-),score=8.88 TRINITY_DN43463_c0_g1_i1:27-338(-)
MGGGTCLARQTPRTTVYYLKQQSHLARRDLGTGTSPVWAAAEVCTLGSDSVCDEGAGSTIVACFFGLVGHSHRFSGGTCAITDSTCCPHPPQVVLPHTVQGFS